MAVFGMADLSKLATALINGDDNIIGRLVESKLESLGEQAILNLVPGLGLAQRTARAIETGGASEFNRMRQQWLHPITPPQLPGVAGKFQRLFEQGARRAQARQRTAWGRTDWATSRQDWLNNAWRHDWRSQPRDPATGRWVPGRLDYIQPSLQYKGRRAGRTVRRWRKLKRARRTAARKAIKDIIS